MCRCIITSIYYTISFFFLSIPNYPKTLHFEIFIKIIKYLFIDCTVKEIRAYCNVLLNIPYHDAKSPYGVYTHPVTLPVAYQL